jgi:hypothetical protein
MVTIRVTSYEGKRYITRYSGKKVSTGKIQRLGVYRPTKKG